MPLLETLQAQKDALDARIATEQTPTDPSQAAAAAASRANGVTAGTAWAEDGATYEDLALLEILARRSGEGSPSGQFAWKQYSWIVVGRYCESNELDYDHHFRDGFVEGALSVWKGVKDHLV